MIKYVIKCLSNPNILEVVEASPAPKNHYGQPPLDNNNNEITDGSILVLKDVWLNPSTNQVELVDVNTPVEAAVFQRAFVDPTLEANKNTELLQKSRDTKLDLMREQRKVLLLETDHMVNDLVLGKRSDSAAVSTYRDALFTITDSYKDTNGATSAIDALASDLSDLVWPVKP